MHGHKFRTANNLTQNKLKKVSDEQRKYILMLGQI